MKIKTIDSGSADHGCDCLVISIDTDGALGETAQRVNDSQGGWLKRAFARGDISGKRLDTQLVPSTVENGPAAYLIVGLGDPKLVDDGAAYELGAAITRRLSDRARERVVVASRDFCTEQHFRAFVTGAWTGTSGQDLYQQKPKCFAPTELVFLDGNEPLATRGTIVGEAMNRTRRWVNEPANFLYPQAFAEQALALGKQYGFEVEVWDEERLANERCEALLAVGRGSAHESVLVKLRYRGGKDTDRPVALVGKGVTFDSGGLSIKPSSSMEDMKCDMAGAATVLGTIVAAAQLGVKENIFGYCGLVENMVAADCFRLGDVLRTRSGKTIEILNTDAEGRVVLADVLNVALDDAPQCMIDLATLTGACVVALGTDVCGLFSNNAEFVDMVRMAAEIVGEPVWELPMFDFYAEQIKSKVADIKNMGDGRWGGAITAAKFLQEFVGDTPWVHIDIAGPAFADSPKPYRDAGATAVMLRTLIRMLESRATS